MYFPRRGERELDFKVTTKKNKKRKSEGGTTRAKCTGTSERCGDPPFSAKLAIKVFFLARRIGAAALDEPMQTTLPEAVLPFSRLLSLSLFFWTV